MSEIKVDQVPIFNSIPPDDLDFLENNLPVLDFAAGTMIIRENEVGDRMYIVMSGEVEVLKSLGSSDQWLVTILRAGDFLGEMCLINRDMKRTASVLARTEVKLLEISQAHFDALITRRPFLAVEIMRELSTRLRLLDNTIIQNLERANREIIRAYDETLAGRAKALELRDHGTVGHTLRVTEMTVRMAEKMGITGNSLTNIRRGAMLHDIGKMGIPDNILLKPTHLTEDEWKIMRQHPTYAHDMLSPIEFLHNTIDIPYCHHEKWDGSGYPRGLKHEEIPLGADFSIVDVWDALTSDRPYRNAMSKSEAINTIRSLAGKHFGPAQVEIFLDLIQGVE